MKSKLEMYQTKLVQHPAIVAGYLNPQIPKRTDPRKLNNLKLIIRSILNDRYADHLIRNVAPPARDGSMEQEATLFEALFARSSDCHVHEEGSSVLAHDEVDRYLDMGITVSHQSFINVVQWWIVRKDVLPGHYQMAMDYLATPATSTPSERVNSISGREFTSARQSLSSDIFVKTMCLRSWMKLDIIKIPRDRQTAALKIGLESFPQLPSNETVDEVVNMIEKEQDEWVEEVLDDDVVGMLNIQFDNMFCESD